MPPAHAFHSAKMGVSAPEDTCAAVRLVVLRPLRCRVLMEISIVFLIVDYGLGCERCLNACMSLRVPAYVPLHSPHLPSACQKLLLRVALCLVYTLNRRLTCCRCVRRVTRPSDRVLHPPRAAHHRRWMPCLPCHPARHQLQHLAHRAGPGWSAPLSCLMCKAVAPV